jgi:hypothetical protein
MLVEKEKIYNNTVEQGKKIIQQMQDKEDGLIPQI